MRLAAAGLALALLAQPGLAHGHHLGTYTPRDNEISANVKEIKFSADARRFEVAARLFDKGAVRREMRARAASLPPGLEAEMRAALQAEDAAEVERALMVFLASLARSLALEAERQVTAASPGPEARAAAGRRFLEAIWRYYNLIDFAVSRRQPKISVEVRLAFDEAETLVKGTAAPAAVNPCAGPRPSAPGAAVDPSRLRDPLRRIAAALGELVERSPSPTRRQS